MNYTFTNSIRQCIVKSAFERNNRPRNRCIKCRLKSAYMNIIRRIYYRSIVFHSLMRVSELNPAHETIGFDRPTVRPSPRTLIIYIRKSPFPHCYMKRKKKGSKISPVTYYLTIYNNNVKISQCTRIKYDGLPVARTGSALLNHKNNKYREATAIVSLVQFPS